MTIKKLGLDLGNSTIKFAYLTDGGKKMTSKIASAFDIRSGNISSTHEAGAVVECNGITIFLGEGMSLNTDDKTNRQHFEHQVLYAVWKAYGTGSHVVKLGVGLPIKTYKMKCDSYSEQLNAISKIQGKVNGESITVNLEQVTVCSEGYASLISLDNKVSSMNPTLIIDIGYKTTDAVAVRWDEALGQYVVEKFETFNIGLYDFLSLMSERLLTKGADMTPEELNKRLNSKNSIIRTETGSGTLNLKTSLDLAKEKYELLISNLGITFGQLIQFDLLFTGGGSKMFLEGIGQDRLKNIVQISDEEKYFSNASGFLEQLIIEDEEE